MKKVLIIEESKLFREYLTKKLSERGLDVITASNGFEGILKIRNEIPDLIVMEYYLSRKSSLEVLAEKKEDPNASKVPVIMITSRIDKKNLVEVAKMGISKFYSKPLKLDSFLKTVAAVLNIKISMDSTPCILDANVNEGVFFVEIAEGINLEKVDLLKYKIRELKSLYGGRVPKVLLIMSNMNLTPKEKPKVHELFRTIIDTSGAAPRLVKVLTKSPVVRDYIRTSKEYSQVEISDNLQTALDDLVGMKPDENVHDVMGETLLATRDQKGQGNFMLKFDSEKADSKESAGPTISVVDDDEVIRKIVSAVFKEAGCTVKEYQDGQQFAEDADRSDTDLVFLDLMMPRMNGFQVLQTLEKESYEPPVIVFSAVSQREAVAKAINYGVRSYLIKPLKPEQLLMKAKEVLEANF